MKIATILAVALFAVAKTAPCQEISAKDVNLAIDRAVDYLFKQQTPQGVWDEHSVQPKALTAICTLAILNAGVKGDDPRLSKALSAMSQQEPSMVYSSSLIIMALTAADPDAKRFSAAIRKHALWLQSAQSHGDRGKGSWGYSRADRNGESSVDNSNAQFALLGLYEAQRAIPNLEITEQTWRLAQQHWIRSQRPDGSWDYDGRQSTVSGSMTCAGIASLIITSGQLSQGDARVDGDAILCCGQNETEDGIERGLTWLGKHFSVDSNPFVRETQLHLLYYLYGMERVGRLSGRRFFENGRGAKYDWYRLGAERLLRRQDPLTGMIQGSIGAEVNSLVSTSLGLLFLGKGRRPTLIAKMRYGVDASRDWDRHPEGVQNLMRHVEKLWKRDLSWQTIDIRSAGVADLAETPVLFMSGSAEIRMDDDEKRRLREFVHQGGFIFAESSEGHGCTGKEFDQSFRSLMRELFPEAPMRLLPADHPIWFAEEAIATEQLKPLYGLDTCCRTAVVYSPETLSCLWSLKRPNRGAGVSERAMDQIRAAASIGANVLAYATNRELKEKLDRPVVANTSSASTLRGSLSIAKLLHSGGADDASRALPNLLRILQSKAEVRVDLEKRLLPASAKELFDHPMLFVHGRRAFRLTEEERKNLKQYLERGGFLFADSICSNAEFADSFRREMKAIFPDKTLERIAPDHPIFTPEFRGFDIRTVALRDPKAREAKDQVGARTVKTTPWIESMEIEDRIIVAFSPYDLSCALENAQSPECKGYTKEDAARIATNIVLYGLSE